jgi:histidinol dehydrogenase
VSAVAGDRSDPLAPRAGTLAAPSVAVVGRVGSLTAAQERALLDRGRATDPAVERAVAAVIAEVRESGDDALRAQARRFDGVELAALEVPREAAERALRELRGELREALEQAADAIRGFHRAQLPSPLEVELRPGVRLGRLAEPLRRVGVYAPGGRASYPSSVLMGVVPARVAGVEEVVVCSPPGAAGMPAPAVLAAAVLAGADRVFALGGAGAVTAMALGTASVPRVDKVVGPGNAYVTEAKRQLAGLVACDCPAGPSELLVVADGSASPGLVAAELLAQAEHDPDTAAVLVSTDADLPRRVQAALGELLAGQPRQAIVRQALAARGALLTAESLTAALAFAARYAPEHLLLLVAEPRAALAAVRCAGTVFLGPGSSVVFGDYTSGANHVLPTNGSARAWSGLSTADFLRVVTWQEVSASAAAELAAASVVLAEAEGLPGHAAAASLRQSPAPAAPAVPAGAAAGLGARPRPRRCLDEVRAYRGAGSVARCVVDLSDNTNLFGVSPAARRVLAGAADEAIARYPSPYADELRGCLAEALGVAAENVTTGCGSDDLLDAIFRAFCAPGDGVALPAPTFGIVPSFARVSAAVPAAVPLGDDLSLDVDGLLACHAAVTYLCRPNNPTGTLFARAAVERLAGESPGLVLLDEAYVDFSAADDQADGAQSAPYAEDGPGLVAWGAASRNVVVLRTFSKAYGLAGLRVGYAVGPAELIAAIEKARGPYKVGAVAGAAAVAALREDAGWVGESVAAAREVRRRLAEELRRRGFAPLDSAANFLFLPTPPATTGGALALADRLRARGVAVRAFPGLPVVGDGIRVTVGPWPLMTRFLAALDEVAFTPGTEA